MRFLGLGTDIIEIQRVANALERHGQSFLDRLFTDSEQAYCAKFHDPLPHLAARFAAKEAVAKALGTGIGAALGWLDMEIGRPPEGPPFVTLSAQARERLGEISLQLSLSHCKEYATATAIAFTP